MLEKLIISDLMLSTGHILLHNVVPVISVPAGIDR